ncbi:MAG: hypothetical protein LKKZDAJK_001428 [Candidatus Fervidibacter sp.]|jgi:hypothetical protein
MRWLCFFAPFLIATTSFANDGAEKALASSVKSRLPSLLVCLQIRREKSKPVETVKEADQRLSEFLEGSHFPQSRENLPKKPLPNLT